MFCFFFFFFCGQKWGNLMFHQYHREMLYVIGYLLRNGGLAWNKKVMGFHQFLYFFSPLKLSFYLFSLPLLLLLSFFFSPWWWWPLLKTQPFKLFVLANLGHISYTPNNTPKGILIIKGFIWNLPFCKLLMKQARDVKQISLFYFFSNLACVCVFEPLKIY